MNNFSFETDLNILRGKAYGEILYTFFKKVPVGELQSKSLRFPRVQYDMTNDIAYCDGVGLDENGELALFIEDKMINLLFSFSTDTLCEIAEIFRIHAYYIHELS